MSDRPRNKTLVQAVEFLAFSIANLMHEECPECGIGLGPHLDDCRLAPLHRTAKELSKKEHDDYTKVQEAILQCEGDGGCRAFKALQAIEEGK